MPQRPRAFRTGRRLQPCLRRSPRTGAQYATSSNIFPPAKPKPPQPAGTPAPKAVFGNALGVDGFKYVLDVMHEAGTKAKAAGLQYAYHNHSHEFEVLPDGTVGYDYLIQNTDPALVKFEIDGGWMFAAGHTPVDYFKKYPGRFRMLHIKDFKPMDKPFTFAGSGVRPTGTELGQGFIDYKPVFAAGKKAGIEHIFAEQEFPYKVSQMDSAVTDAAYLKSFS